jgi:hypothetical protein
MRVLTQPELNAMRRFYAGYAAFKVGKDFAALIDTVETLLPIVNTALEWRHWERRAAAAVLPGFDRDIAEIEGSKLRAALDALLPVKKFI